MDIKEIKSERVAEKYYKINHPSGLTIYVYPKEGYNSAYAIFGTRYGSINRKDRKSTRLSSSHRCTSRMPSSA